MMELKPFKKTTWYPLARSVLASLHEPLQDPKDGHGARSKRDVLILQMWNAAKKGDDVALIDLVKIIVRENLTELKASRSTRRFYLEPGGEMKMRSLESVMTLLRMITVETVPVALERDGHAKLTSRRKITFESWFEDYALDRPEADPKVVEGVRNWIARGAIQRPFRGEICD